MNSSPFKTAIFPSRYIQGPGAINALPEWIGKLGTKSILVAGNTAMREWVPGIIPRLHDPLVELFGGECTDAEIDRISEKARQANYDVAVALGGGKVIDTVKAVSQAIQPKRT